MFDSVRALLASALALLHGRLELAGEELRRETARLAACLFTGLAALFLLGLGLAFAAVTAMIAVGEQFRVHVALALSMLFLLGGGVIAYRLRRALLTAPRLMDATLTELEKDHRLLNRLEAQRDEVRQHGTQMGPKIALAKRAIAVSQAVGSILMLLGVVGKLFRRRSQRSED